MYTQKCYQCQKHHFCNCTSMVCTKTLLASWKCYQHRYTFTSIYNLQIPFVIVTLGPEPVTRSAKVTMIESAWDRKFHPDDFKNIDRKGTGVVLSYNGKNHYCPTLIISQKYFVTWQLQCVGHMAGATITFINDIDQNNCTPQQKSFLLKMESILTESVRSFGRAAATIYSHRYKGSKGCYVFTTSRNCESAWHF